MTHLGRVGQDGYDSFGEVFGQIAMQFGKDLIAAQRQAAVKNISTNITRQFKMVLAELVLSKGFNLC